MNLRRFLRDSVIRVAILVLAFDWIVVGWRTFVWIDLVCWAAIALAMKED